MVVLVSMAGSIVRARGWPRRIMALMAGVASVLAMAPFFLTPVLFVTLPIFVWLLDGAILDDPSPARPGSHAPSHGARWKLGRAFDHRAGRAASVGWWFGFGYFTAGLFWIGEAFLVEAERFAALLPVAVTLLPAGLALFWAAATAAASLAWRPGMGRILALALALSVAEWLRGHVLSGFPWNIIGYALTWPLELMQAAAVLGIYGLTLVSVLLFGSPLVLWADAGQDGSGSRRRLIGSCAALMVLLGMYAFGLWRLASNEPTVAHETRVRIVQPSVPQREKWRPEHQERIFNAHLELSLRDATGVSDGATGVQLILWPEAAMPFLPLQTPAALAAIGRMLPEGTHLVSGALRLEEADPLAPPGSRSARRRVYNSLMVFDADGRAIQSYDKTHLVPFGEYLPLQAALESVGLEQLTRLRGGFATGIVPRPLIAIESLPRFAPLICYEAIFPGTVVQSGRPAALLNVTNDGWFGNTTGPRQHLHQARVRAVEQGLPLLRAANNGISAIVDAKGRLRHSLGLDVVGTIDAVMPAPLDDPPPYARFGDGLFGVGLAVLAGLLALGSGRASRN